ncbi:MAG: hypothetical protein ACERKD_06305 [Prolixibacteraceae bacterium]
MNRKLTTIFLFIFSSTSLFGQGWLVDENTIQTNWNITFQVGRSALLGEVKTDFSGLMSDVNNQSDWAFNLQMAKMVWDSFDLGFEFGISNYKGFKNSTASVNYLMLNHSFNDEDKNFQPYPIYYDSDVTHFLVYAKYNFINFSTFSQSFLKLNLYVKLGFGLLLPSVEMGYKDLSNYNFTGLQHPLYLKGRYPSPQKYAHLIINPPALGMNYQLSDRIFLSAETSYQLNATDYIDGIPNFNKQLTPEVPDALLDEYRINVMGLTAKFMLGVTYFFNFDTHKQLRLRTLPFYEYRYRSYYSRYQKRSSKKQRQQRTPFFKENFKIEKK